MNVVSKDFLQIWDLDLRRAEIQVLPNREWFVISWFNLWLVVVVVNLLRLGGGD